MIRSLHRGLALFAWLLTALPAAALKTITLSVPGPRNLSYLPIDLIPRAKGARLEWHLL
jgi:hypothetical protein